MSMSNHVPEVTICDISGGIGGAVGKRKNTPGMLGSLDFISSSYDASNDSSRSLRSPRTRSKKSVSLWDMFKSKSKGERNYHFNVENFDDIPNEALHNVSRRAMDYGETHLDTFVSILNFSTKYHLTIDGVELRRDKRWVDPKLIDQARADLVECGVIREFYKIKSTIGSGAFGKVSKAVDRETLEIVAIKQLSRGDTERDIHEAFMEVSFLKVSNHPNLLSFRRLLMAKNKIFLATEYINGENLEKLIMLMDFNKNFLCITSKAILSGLEHIHALDIIHMDLKGSNIMISFDGAIKIVDFGLSTQVEDTMRGMRGSAFWVAPEMILSTGYNTKIDIWAFGIIFLSMLLRDTPNYHSKIDAMVTAVSDTISEHFPTCIEEECRSFLSHCLQGNPENRASATELLAHPYLQYVTDEEAFCTSLYTAIMVESVIPT